MTFTNVIGTQYIGVEFADVPPNAFITNGQQTILTGAAAFYPHRFTAGTAGQLTISASAPATTG